MDTLTPSHIEIADTSHDFTARQDLGGLAIGALTIGIAGVILAVVAKTTSDFAAVQTDAVNVTSSFHNATNNIQGGYVTFGSNFSILGTLIGLTAIVGLLIGAFMLFREQ